MEGKLKKGYDKLIAFETTDKGYEWFGKSPAHEALSAYGLMQFHEMSNVTTMVDQKMVSRVKTWLLERTLFSEQLQFNTFSTVSMTIQESNFSLIHGGVL